MHTRPNRWPAQLPGDPDRGRASGCVRLTTARRSGASLRGAGRQGRLHRSHGDHGQEVRGFWIRADHVVAISPSRSCCQRTAGRLRHAGSGVGFGARTRGSQRGAGGQQDRSQQNDPLRSESRGSYARRPPDISSEGRSSFESFGGITRRPGEDAVVAYSKQQGEAQGKQQARLHQPCPPRAGSQGRRRCSRPVRPGGAARPGGWSWGSCSRFRSAHKGSM